MTTAVARTRLSLYSVLILVVAAATCEAAQARATAADLAGVIADRTGGVMAQVSIVATNRDTNLSRTTITDTEGRFVVPALPPGTYTIRAVKPGFAPRVVEDIVLTVGSVIEVRVQLEVGDVQTAVAVSESVTRPNHIAAAHLIGRLQLDRLPVNGRNFVALSLLNPGLATDRTPQQGVSLNSGLTVAGQHARSNNITVDGLDNNELTIGAVRESFSQEAVREFQVLTVGYPAEFGKASGGVVNVVTRSGSNAFRGTAFGYFRDDALNAKEHFERYDVFGAPVDRRKSPFSQKQFGGTFDGPMRRNRTFFFGSFERLGIRAHNFVTIDDQTIVVHPVSSTPLGTPAAILRSAGFPVETGYAPYAVKSTQGLFKVNQQLGGGQHLSLRFSRSVGLNENIEPFGGIVARSRAGASHSRHTALAGSLTSLISSKALNEVRFQVSEQDFALRALDPRCEGPCTRLEQGGPTLEVTGVASVGRHRITPSARDMVRIQVVDTFSYYRGEHHIKTGLDFNWVRFTRYSVPLNIGGRFIFAPLPAIPGLTPSSMSAIQAVALGYPAAYAQGYGDSALAFDYQDLSLFAQDEWRLRPRLTVNLGVRYQTQFWPRHEYRVPGYPGPFPYPRDRNDVAPRLAATWQVSNDLRTSVHASYGMFFDNTIAVLYTLPSIVNGDTGVRTAALRLPRSVGAWNAPGHRLSEAAIGPFPSVRITIDPDLKTPYAHHFATGFTREFTGGHVLSASLVQARGFNLVGALDFNPLVPSLGPGRRPEDLRGVSGTSASILQYSAFGQTWYRGLILSWRGQLGPESEILASYTLSKAEDTATDFQTAFVPQDNGHGRNPADPDGWPIGFDPADERGPANHDQRHRFVLSGVFRLPAGFRTSAILTIGSGRPFNILAGSDLNGDGDGGAFPSDRARRNPGDLSTSVGRNSGLGPGRGSLDLRISRRLQLPGPSSVEAILEIFNVFNRVNYTDVNNVFGPGAYPTSPLPTFGTFLQTGPSRQVQLAVRWVF